MVPCPHPTLPPTTPSRPWLVDKATQSCWNANVWEPIHWAGTKAGKTGSTLPFGLPGCMTLDKSSKLNQNGSWRQFLKTHALDSGFAYKE